VGVGASKYYLDFLIVALDFIGVEEIKKNVDVLLKLGVFVVNEGQVINVC
jgi:hypothetical protein